MRAITWNPRKQCTQSLYCNSAAIILSWSYDALWDCSQIPTPLKYGKTDSVVVRIIKRCESLTKYMASKLYYLECDVLLLHPWNTAAGSENTPRANKFWILLFYWILNSYIREQYRFLFSVSQSLKEVRLSGFPPTCEARQALVGVWRYPFVVTW